MVCHCALEGRVVEVLPEARIADNHCTSNGAVSTILQARISSLHEGLYHNQMLCHQLVFDDEEEHSDAMVADWRTLKAWTVIAFATPSSSSSSSTPVKMSMYIWPVAEYESPETTKLGANEGYPSTASVD